MKIPEVQQQFDEFLQGKGLRKTSQRDTVVKAVFSSQDHFTADDLLERSRRADSTTSRATVYRTLALLVESGLLQEIDLGKDNKYYDPNFLERPHHNHLICTDCDMVVEFEDANLNVLEDCISRRLGFKPERKAIRIEASCEEFQRLGACSRSSKGDAIEGT